MVDSVSAVDAHGSIEANSLTGSCGCCSSDERILMSYTTLHSSSIFLPLKASVCLSSCKPVQQLYKLASMWAAWVWQIESEADLQQQQQLEH